MSDQTTAPHRIPDTGQARMARENVTYFLGRFEDEPGYVTAWAEFTAALNKVRARITTDEANEIDEAAFTAAVVVSHIITNRVYTSMAQTFFPAALDAEKEAPSA